MNNYKAWKDMTVEERIEVAFLNWRRAVIKDDDDQIKKWYVILKKQIRASAREEDNETIIEA